jgi:hypothetical protein
MSTPVASPPPPVHDPLNAAAFQMFFTLALRQAGLAPETRPATQVTQPAAEPTTGARILSVAIKSKGAMPLLRRDEVVVAVDGHPTPDADAFLVASARRDPTGTQTFDVVSPIRMGLRQVKVGPGEIEIKVADAWLLEGQYLHELPTGVQPSDEVRIAARSVSSSPALAEAAMAHALRAGGPATTTPVALAVAAYALFNDARYDDALAYATAARPGLPVDCQTRLDQLIGDAALATFRFPLAVTVANRSPWYRPRVLPAAAEIDDYQARPHKVPMRNPVAAGVEFTDRSGHLLNAAPDANNEAANSAAKIQSVAGNGTMPFDVADGKYTILECGPAGANVDFSAKCHFRITDLGHSGYPKVVRIGVTDGAGGTTLKELELYADGQADVVADDVPHAQLDLRRFIARGAPFDVRMTVVGDRYEVVIDGRRVFYGPMPSLAAEADRNLDLVVQCVGVTGELADLHWRTAGPRKP